MSMSGTRASYSLDGGGFNHGASNSSQLYHRRPDLKKKLVVVRPTSYVLTLPTRQSSI